MKANFWPLVRLTDVALVDVGVALGVALGITGLTRLQFYSNGATSVAIDAIWNVFNSFTLSAVPMFILLGEILLRSGISEKAYAAFSPVFRRIPGGLLHTNIAVCTLFGAVSGSSLSTAAAVGSVAYPEMSKRGYDKDTVKRVEHLRYISEYKRFQSGPGTRLSRHAFWLDRRYPIANKWRDNS